VLATDVDTAVLETAERAIYPMERVEPVSRERLKRFFLSGTGPNSGHARVRPEVARLVQFRRLNLSDARWDVQGPFDAVFCRNVMIYFDKPTQHEILQRIARVLAPDGLLFAGHSESFLHAGELFQAVGKTVYRPLARA
jgi:chemotaxis protein methyltransferase CheR